MQGNKAKAALLGMPFGTATGKLRKSILFALLMELGATLCYRCGLEIQHEEELSIEHKESWASSENPVDRFFNLDNISFSHLSCNVAAAIRPNKIYSSVSDRRKAQWDRYYSRPEKREAHLARKRRVYALRKAGDLTSL